MLPQINFFYLLTVAAYYEEYGGKVYNSGVLVSREGKVAGRYRKTHLPAGEKHMVAVGDEYPVFDVDFGKIGMLICYDMMFPEVVGILALNGAQILFNPTQGFQFGGEINGEMRIRVRAFDNSVYIVTSKCASGQKNAPGMSCIVDFDGHVLAGAGYEPDMFVSAIIDMDRKHSELTDAEEAGIPDLRERFMKERRPETYGAIIILRKNSNSIL